MACWHFFLCERGNNYESMLNLDCRSDNEFDCRGCRNGLRTRAAVESKSGFAGPAIVLLRYCRSSRAVHGKIYAIGGVATNLGPVLAKVEKDDPGRTAFAAEVVNEKFILSAEREPF